MGPKRVTRRERKQRSESLGLGAECNIDFPKAWGFSEDNWEEGRNAIMEEAITIDPCGRAYLAGVVPP